MLQYQRDLYYFALPAF